jgi:hypothetical protein
MPKSMANKLASWTEQFSRHSSSEIWKAIPLCLVWCLGGENGRTFKGHPWKNSSCRLSFSSWVDFLHFPGF